MLRDSLRGLGVVGMDDPMPTAGSLSTGRSVAPGRIGLVGSMGRQRFATYRDIYLMNPFVYASANFIAQGIGRVPLHVFQFDANAEKQRMRSDIPQTPGRPNAGVQLDRILSKPANVISRMSFIGGTMRERLIQGNGLWEILDNPSGGLPVGLRRISWSNVVRVQEDGYGNAEWYEVQPRGATAERRRLYPEQVIHFGLGSEADQACGISILESCHHTLALHEALMRHLMAYFENSARGSGHFKVDNHRQAAEARQMITELYTSPENAGKVLVTSAEWKSMADTPEHSSIVDLIKESRTEVAAAFKVPPPVLGLLEHAIRANVKEMREQFYRDTIGPWASEFESEFQAQLLDRYGAWAPMFTEFELAEQLRPDLEARALVYQRLMFVFSIDEIRAMENKPPFKIEDVTDVPWAGSGQLPLTTAARGKNGTGAPLPDPEQESVVGLAMQAAELEDFLETFQARSRDELRAVMAEQEPPELPPVVVNNNFHKGAIQSDTHIDEGAIQATVEAPPPAHVSVEAAPAPELHIHNDRGPRSVVVRRGGTETTYEQSEG